MNCASLFAPKHASTGVATHHHHRGVLAVVPIDRVFRYQGEHLAIVFAERSDGMDVTTA
jgi:hypothetical protein